jgi:hypothetical protein
MPAEGSRQQPFLKVKEDGDNDRDRPKAPSVVPGVIMLSSTDAACLISYVLRTRSHDSWMVDVLTHGSTEYRNNPLI